MKHHEIISEMLNIISPVLQNENKEREKFPVGFTFNLVLERLEFNLYSLETLTKFNREKHDFGIALLCRNILSDYLLIAYIIANSNKNDEKYFFSYIYSDVKKTEDYINLSEIHGITDGEDYSDLKTTLNNLTNLTKKYWEGVETKGPIKIPTTKEIFINFRTENIEHPFSKSVTDAYDIWLEFSKFEHLSLSYYMITSKIPKDKRHFQLRSVLSMAIFLAAACLEELKELESAKKLLFLNELID
jgi:hypothetical protein